MTPVPKRTAWVVAVGIMTGSCAGDGTGLAGPVPLAPTLSSLQQNIFTPICTQCHTGAVAPLALALDSGISRQNLVGVASVQVPAMARVVPGDPEASYLVWKIEGRQGVVGEQMPRGLQPLSPTEISAVREWIQNGAADD